MAIAIVPAAGEGRRLGATAAVPKYLAEIAGRPMLSHTLRRLAAAPSIAALVVAVPQGDEERVRDLAAGWGLGLPLTVVAGGVTRQESVANGLAAIAGLADEDIVVVHDAARPLVTSAEIERTVAAAIEHGAAIAAAAIVDTVKRAVQISDSEATSGAGPFVRFIAATLPRDDLFGAKTPQAARAGLLRRALAAAARDGFTGTDEASLLERLGEPVAVVAASDYNLKVTHASDLELVARIMELGL